jgi:hypothetical protein
MNTVFVSGTVNTPAQLKMGDQGYLVTFMMTNQDECKDERGVLKQINTKWSVSLQYDEEPVSVVKKLEKGIKILVKGDAKISHKEVDDIFEMDCFLNGTTLDFLDATLKNKKAVSSKEFTELQANAIAS